MEGALLAERHPLWACLCPELDEINIIYACAAFVLRKPNIDKPVAISNIALGTGTAEIFPSLKETGVISLPKESDKTTLLRSKVPTPEFTTSKETD